MFKAVTVCIVTAQLVQIIFGEQIKLIIESLDKKQTGKIKQTKIIIILIIIIKQKKVIDDLFAFGNLLFILQILYFSLYSFQNCAG